MLCAIKVLADQKGGDRILALGDMLCLGKNAKELHRQIGREARVWGIERLLAFGALAREAAEGFREGGAWFESKERLSSELRMVMNKNSIVLKV